MRPLFILALTLITSHSFAQPMSVKERLRVLLWVQGLEETPTKRPAPSMKPIPEELEKPLRKIF